MSYIIIMHFLLATVLFLEIFVGYYAQVSGDFACEEGEEYDMCRSPCESTCDNIRQGFHRNCSRPCISGCFCRRGLVRADENTCVPPSECIRPVCLENEEYLDCGSPCASNCTNLNKPIFCTKPCYRGCFCKPNFVRDSRGKCIDPRNCRSAGNVQCPSNEEYVNCVNFCSACHVPEYCQTPYCTPGCDCKPGYFRNTYGECVTEEQCIAEEYALQQQCGLNEVYTSCVNMCNDCDSRGRCDDYLFNYCKPGCDCKAGFFRNDNGACVPEWNCLRERQPICSPGEEYYDCIPTCRVTCDTYNTADVICDTTCNRGCFCKKGLVRRGDGLCVSPTECPARPLPCPEGETLYQCLPTCRTTCRTFNSSRGLCSTECRQGCFCQPGFVRNDNGICVPPSECPSACGLNEEFRTCGSACPATCENFRENRACPQQRCLRGCFCKTGFVRGPRGICIRPRNCPIQNPTPCCGGFRGRKKGNETSEDITTVASTTTTPVTTEIPSNDSSTASSSTATKPSAISGKVSDKTTPKSVEATTIPKSAAATTTETPTTTSAESKAEPTNSTTSPTESPSATVTEGHTNRNPTPCCGGLRGRKKGNETNEDTTTVASTTITPVATETLSNDSSSVSSSTATKPSATSEKMSDKTTPKAVDAATIPKVAVLTTSEIPTATTAESKAEPFNSTTFPTETPTATVTELTNSTELTTLPDLTNSTTTKP